MPTPVTKPALLASLVLVLVPTLALAQEGDPGDLGAADAEYAEVEVTPDSPTPAWTPPPPAEAQVQPSQAQVPPGQWVYTQQYGWIWMPHGDAYTHAPASGWGEPSAYVYVPAYSTWTWVAAPWVWGYGPWPVFGVFGPSRFAWYGHGWWRSPARWHYAPAHRWSSGGLRVAPYSPRSGGWSAPRFAPSRGGFGVFRGSAGDGHGLRGSGRGGAAIGGHGVRGGGNGHGGDRGGGNGRGGGGHGRW